VDIIINKITGRVLVPSRLYFPLIHRTPINKASGKKRIFAIVFFTLYSIRKADLNTCRLRKVGITKYTRHLLYFQDGRFSRHPRWKFLVFNILIQTHARDSAYYYVSKTSGLRDLDRDELIEALLGNTNLVKHIARQGACLTGTRPFWRTKSTAL
jgi:hypothetical protein